MKAKMPESVSKPITVGVRVSEEEIVRIKAVMHDLALLPGLEFGVASIARVLMLMGLEAHDEKGRRKSAHHQWLTEDIGHPALAQHLHAVVGLMRASSSWKQFHDMLDKAFPKRGSVLQLELIET
jgi:hypothetical protein